MESEAKIGDRFLLKLSDGIELLDDFALWNAPVKEVQKCCAELIEGCKGRDIELGVPLGGVPIESESKFDDFRSVSFSLRKPLCHMVCAPNIEE